MVSLCTTRTVALALWLSFELQRGSAVSVLGVVVLIYSQMTMSSVLYG